MMRATLAVFPVKGRNWCFSRSMDSLISGDTSKLSSTPTTVRDLWKSLSSSSQPVTANTELLVDFFSHKMNTACTGLEKAPQGSFKNKIYGVGSWLLSRVKPSELFLKSISKEVTGVEVTYPTSLNARLVRRRLRHIAMRWPLYSANIHFASWKRIVLKRCGSIIHKKYLYGSAALLPVSSDFMALPLPNIPFFWLLYRTYSHWRAWQLKLLGACSALLLNDGELEANQHQEFNDGDLEADQHQGEANNQRKTEKKKGKKKPKPPKIKIILYAGYGGSQVRFNIPFSCKTVRDLKGLVAKKLSVEEEAFELLYTDDQNQEITIFGDDDVEVLVKMTSKLTPTINTIRIQFKY